MTIQEVIVLAFIAASLVYWLRGIVRPKSGCSSGCGKCTTTATAPVKGRIGLPQV